MTSGVKIILGNPHGWQGSERATGMKSRTGAREADWPSCVIGFRIAYDGDCRVFAGCVHGCNKPERRFSLYQERGTAMSPAVGFRLVRGEEAPWPTK
jgi:hypothetical protein